MNAENYAGKSTIVTDSSHSTTAFLGNDVVTASVDHTGEGNADNPAKSTNEKVKESGRENIYPVNFDGSYDFDYHIIVCDPHKTIIHVSISFCPEETINIRIHIRDGDDIVSAIINHSTDVNCGGEHHHTHVKGTKMGMINEVGRRSAMIVLVDGHLHTVTSSYVLHEEGAIEDHVITIDVVDSPCRVPISSETNIAVILLKLSREAKANSVRGKNSIPSHFEIDSSVTALKDRIDENTTTE